MGRLEGKICIVTGGARGLGLAFSRALAGEGALVAIADIADGAAAAREIGGLFLKRMYPIPKAPGTVPRKPRECSVPPTS